MASQRWKNLERTAAEVLGGTRVVEHWTLFRERPDVIVGLRDGRRLVVDAKAHKAFSHHTLIDSVRKKYCRPGDVPCLVTKSARQIGEYVTIPLSFLAELLNALASNTSGVKETENTNDFGGSEGEETPVDPLSVCSDTRKAAAGR